MLKIFVAIHMAIKDPIAIEVDLAVATKKTQIDVLVEILYLESQKKPSSSTYYNLK